MKKSLVASLLLLGSLSVLRADPPEAPKLSGARLTGQGVCEVHYDKDGRVDRATMVHSTGSSLLDSETLESAKTYWRGLPRSSATVPIKYTKAPVLAQGGKPMRYKTPLPPYPYSAQSAGTEGSGIIQVLFDAQGKPEFVNMAKSTGSKELDDNTVHFAQAYWRSSGGEEGTMTLPIYYRLIKKTAGGIHSVIGSTGSNIQRPDPTQVQAIVTL